VKEEGFGAEIIDLPELKALEQIDFPINSILLGGPYFSDKLLNYIVKNPPLYLVVYDLGDLNRLESAFSKVGQSIDIIVRFQALSFTGRHGVSYTPENLQQIYNLFTQFRFIRFAGILSHSGTQLNSLKEYLDNIKYLIQIANELRDKFGLVTRIFNMGGGFPNADSITKESLREILENIKLEFEKANWTAFKLFYEPGRFIVGDAGFCLARIVKYSREQKTAYLDVGNNYIPKFMKSSLRFYNVSKIEEKPNTPVDFYGNIPSDQDILIKKYNFTPSIAAGDYVLIANVGAYALTFSNRFPYARPYILLLDNEDIKILYKTEETLDF
jgi:diaminopimelate decarboxylase